MVAAKLKKRVASDSIVALVRNPEKTLKLEVEARAFDYIKSDELVDALAGIDHLLLISSNEIGLRANLQAVHERGCIGEGVVKKKDCRREQKEQLVHVTGYGG